MEIAGNLNGTPQLWGTIRGQPLANRSKDDVRAAMVPFGLRPCFRILLPFVKSVPSSKAVSLLLDSVSHSRTRHIWHRVQLAVDFDGLWTKHLKLQLLGAPASTPCFLILGIRAQTCLAVFLIYTLAQHSFFFSAKHSDHLNQSG